VFAVAAESVCALAPTQRNNAGCADYYSAHACPAGQPQLASEAWRRTDIAELRMKITVGLHDLRSLCFQTPQLLSCSGGVTTFQDTQNGDRQSASFYFTLSESTSSLMSSDLCLTSRSSFMQMCSFHAERTTAILRRSFPTTELN
jgi:hypothetical protein